MSSKYLKIKLEVFLSFHMKSFLNERADQGEMEKILDSKLQFFRVSGVQSGLTQVDLTVCFAGEQAGFIDRSRGGHKVLKGQLSECNQWLISYSGSTVAGITTGS